MKCCKILLTLTLFPFLSIGHRENSQYYKNIYDTLRIRRHNATQTERSIITEKPEHEKIKIDVYYETLCPGSKDFITTQLRPAVQKLSTSLDVHLIPYGHATTRFVRGRYLFSCQHGSPECYGNKLHACIIDALGNSTQAVLFNACLLDYISYWTDDYASIINWCSYTLDIHIPNLSACVNGNRGSALLKKYGEMTKRLHPRYVPYILLDDSPNNQDQAMQNLINTLCDMLQPMPLGCYS